MLSKLIESWLDNASEKSYQPAFCQMLMSQGYTVISQHSALQYRIRKGCACDCQ